MKNQTMPGISSLPHYPVPYQKTSVFCVHLPKRTSVDRFVTSTKCHDPSINLFSGHESHKNENHGHGHCLAGSRSSTHHHHHHPSYRTFCFRALFVVAPKINASPFLWFWFPIFFFVSFVFDILWQKQKMTSTLRRERMMVLHRYRRYVLCTIFVQKKDSLFTRNEHTRCRCCAVKKDSLG